MLLVSFDSGSRRNCCTLKKGLVDICLNAPLHGFIIVKASIFRNSHMADFFSICCHFTALNTEGIFRRSANTQVVREVQQKYNMGKCPNTSEALSFLHCYYPAATVLELVHDGSSPSLIGL